MAIADGLPNYRGLLRKELLIDRTSQQRWITLIP
jgi:hypothetical protein